jgi:sugar lactone lactonase YvrE
MSDATEKSTLKHKPPEIVKLDSTDANKAREALEMKEVKLPHAHQTHEVCWDPVTKHVFVTQMTNSTLVRIGVDSRGMLLDEQEAWSIGPENGGLHNASVSYKHPGCLWLSMQYLNTLVLVDVRPENMLQVKQIYQVPSYFKTEAGEILHVGGPHCVRECPHTGNIWACLKGALDDNKNGNPCGKLSQCCDPDKLKESMGIHSGDPAFDIRIPNSYAVWQLAPEDYNPDCELGSKGGKLYHCRNSPPMLALDSKGNAWVPQDQSDTLLFIDQKEKRAEQLQVPWPEDTKVSEKHAGPGIATAPDGSIWMVQLETMSSMVRIDPETKERVLYVIQTPEWARGIRMIHLDFRAATPGSGHHNRIYAISSTLLQDESTDALFILNMSEDWTHVKGMRVVPLPSQGCACHRIVYCDIDDGDNEVDDGSVFITELTRSKLLQVKINSDVLMHSLDLSVDEGPGGFKHLHYDMTEDVFFGRPTTSTD